jgi:activator of 2-hydroxyglutaryl-CoA dehydratase
VKCYQLSKGNPIEDTQDMFENLREQVEEQGATLEILGVGTTGYAKDILKDVLNADAAIVETVAHTEAALHFYPHADVICDVGGQDIKLIILQDGRVKDFKLNTQCSAGNGYFLQSTAMGFGYEVTQFADLAFSAKAMPMFGYGCAVSSCSPISLISSARVGSRRKFSPAWPTCCRRTSGSTFRRFPTSPRSARPSSCRAARSTIWPPSSPG